MSFRFGNIGTKRVFIKVVTINRAFPLNQLSKPFVILKETKKNLSKLFLAFYSQFF